VLYVAKIIQGDTHSKKASRDHEDAEPDLPKLLERE
jgi:hypothetical protein